VKPEDCPKLDECYKIKMILDKDLLEFQYAEAIRAVCATCSEAHQSDKKSSSYKPIVICKPGKPEDCPKLDECYKIKMILDKDLLEFQYAEAIRAVCAACPEAYQSVTPEKEQDNP
jgi:hypothetical protein